MTLSHWGKTIIEEKHQTVMRWVTTTVDETDSQVVVHRLLESDVLRPLVANFFVFDLKATIHAEINMSELHLPLENVSRHVRAAYEKAYSYLLAPETFLADFLASIEGVTLDDTFHHKLEVFTEHEYFPALLSAWAEHSKEKGEGFIPRTDLIVKLRDIDMLILRHATISTLVDLLDPLYDFHRHRSTDPAIPASELVRFFEDKGLTPAANEFQKRGDEPLKIKEAVNVISELIGIGISTSEIPKIPDGVPEAPAYPETQYDAFLQDLHEAGVDIRVPIDNGQSLPPIELFIEPKLRDRTIEKVFHGRKEEYQRLIGLLNASKDIQKAILNLETTLKLQRADPKSKIARRLREAAALRFHQYLT